MILTEDFLNNQGPIYHFDANIRKEQILNENSCLFAKTKNWDLFISHSSLDNKLVFTLIKLFNKAHYSVYVDYIEDNRLDRSNVDYRTAEILRKRMKSCHGLAYISTSNIVTSKWCPWELGYVDGNKNGRCAILPILKTNSNVFKGQEYLSLYPYIDYEKSKNTGEFDFWVNNPQKSEKYTTLREWLNGKNIFMNTID